MKRPRSGREKKGSDPFFAVRGKQGSDPNFGTRREKGSDPFIVAVLVGLLGACGGDDRVELPSTIWYVADQTLVRYSGGTRTEIGRNLYPSSFALPDGRLVAIYSRGDGEANAEQLALVRPDGRIDRIGPTAAQVRDPAVDRRGRWIVVAANLDGHGDLYRVDLGGAVTRLTNHAAGNYSPALIGDSIAYVSSRDGDSEIYRDDVRLTAFHRDDWQPTPSPDGKTIAFLSDREGAPHIYLMDIDGANVRRLTTNTVEESAPTWSPDGKRLAYVAEHRVWLRDLAAGHDHLVTIGDEPAFSPDGQWLAVSRVQGTDSSVWAVRIDSTESVQVAAVGQLPRWR